MARKTSTELYELVKSLSSSEKRYFRIFATLHTVGDENKYMKLFELIDQCDDYNEEAILKGLNEKGGVTFSKLKRYLYDLILKAMRNYNTDKNGTHQLTSAIDDMSILFNKGLYKQALKALEKAQKVATEFDLISYNFLLNNWETRIGLHLNSPKDNNNAIATNMQDFKTLNLQMEAYGAIQEFTRNHSVICNMEQLPEKVIAALNTKISDNASAKIAFFHKRTLSVYLRLIRNFEKYQLVAQEVYELSTKHPAFRNEDVLIFTLEPLIEYCNALLNNRKFADFHHYIKKTKPYVLESKMAISDEGRANIDAYVNLMNSEYDRLNGRIINYEDHIATIQQIRADAKLHPSPALKNLYYWELINWYFKMKEFEKAIETIDQMRREIPNYQTIQAAKAVKWLCFFELKWSADLRYEINNGEHSSRLETALADALLQQLDNETMGKWMVLKNDLTKLKNFPEEVMHYKFFNFIDWVNSRMLNDDSIAPIKRQLHYYHH